MHLYFVTQLITIAYHVFIFHVLPLEDGLNSISGVLD